jgi:predicted acetyltransferase
MPARYRTAAADEHAAVVDLIVHVGFGGAPPPEDYLKVAPVEQFRVLDDAGELLSALRVSRLAQWWLGRAVPSAQVLQLATPPQHRGRGHGSRLLADLLAELHQAGVPTVTLRPSNFPFYRTSGFEAAGAWSMYETRCEHLPKRLGPYQARQVPVDELMTEPRALYQEIAPTRHGALARDDLSWRYITRRARERNALCLMLDGPAGRPAGWVVVGFEPQLSSPAPTTRLQVLDWGCLPGADGALMALLAGYAPMGGVVRWSGPDPDPALFALPDLHAQLVNRFHWMLRVVDLRAAFQARPYPARVAGRIVFEVDDPVCPWNSGTWRLEVAGGGARVEPVTGGAGGGAVRAGPRGLAPLFTGLTDPADLVRAGLLAPLGPDGLEFLRAAFASPRPWTAELY